ncbi:MAG: PEP-CTERM system TPR-repeat protein PrsT [Methyloversatilis sp.]|nr:PEP-CTERM system TPR-repeat protein PrsT [Methyloversatilis sp.]
MKPTFPTLPRVSRLLAILLCASALAACDRSKPPEELLAEARAALERRDTQTASIQLKNVLQQDGNNAAARYELGRLYLQFGDPLSAVKELQRASELQHPMDEVAPLLARAMVEAGESADAVSRFSAMKLTKPDAQANLKAAVGYALMATGDVKGAAAAFDAALAIDSAHVYAMVGKARLLGTQRDLKGATALLEQVFASGQASPEAWFLDGEIKSMQGLFEPALASYRKVYEIKPDSVRARAIVISALANEGRVSEARKELAGLRKVAPKSVEVSYLDGLLNIKERKYAEARDALNKTLATAPNFVPALGLAALAAFELKSYSLAEQHAEKAIANGGDSMFVRKVLIGSYLRSGRTDKARQALAPLLKDKADDAEVQSLAGQVYLAGGDAVAAEKAFALAAAKSPDDVSAQSRLGISRLASGDRAGGIRALETAAKLDDNDHRGDLILIMTHLRNRDADKAFMAIDELERKNPKDPITENLRGAAFLLKGDGKNARAAFERALAIEPAYFPAASNLARLDMLDGKQADAEARFSSVLAKAPEHAEALISLAGLKARNKAGFADASALLRKAIEGNPKQAAPRLALVDLQLASDKPRDALKTASDAVAALPDDASVMNALALAQARSGDLDAAITTRTKLAERDPLSAAPLLSLAVVQMSAKRESEAIQTVRKALLLQPDMLEAQNLLIAIHRTRNSLDDALRVARDVQRQRPKEAIGYTMEGELLTGAGKLDGALKAYREALARERTGNNVLRVHAILERTGASRDAQALVDSWLKEQPRDTVIPLYLGDIALAKKSMDEARMRYEMVLARSPGSAVALNNLAWIAAQTKDPKARSYAEQAYAVAPGNAAVLDTYGAILVDAGEVDRGLQMMQSAVAIAPAANELRFNLASTLARLGRKQEARKALEPLVALGSKYERAAEVADLMKTL